MEKLFLLSVVVAVIAVPTLAARERGTRRGAQKAFALLSVFVGLYWAGLWWMGG